MQHSPKYTVIIPTHSRPRALARAIASIKSQTHGGIALIVVADEFSSETRDVAARLLSEGDLFITRNGRPGPAASRNVGLKCANTPYVAFLDDDDEFVPSHIETADRFIRDRENRLFFSEFSTFNYSERTGMADKEVLNKIAIGGRRADEIYVKNFIPNSCLIYPTQAIRGRQFDEALVLNEDWDFILNVVQSVPLELIPSPADHGPVLYGVNAESDNRSYDNNERLVDVYVSIYKKWPARTQELRLARQSFLASAGITLPIELF